MFEDQLSVSTIQLEVCSALVSEHVEGESRGSEAKTWVMKEKKVETTHCDCVQTCHLPIIQKQIHPSVIADTPSACGQAKRGQPLP
jgi:hypothetical protein